MVISSELLQFLNDLGNNNNRDWFIENKPVYENHRSDFKAFTEKLQELLEKTDRIESVNLFRIYRDVRFSKDKTPYNPRFAGSFKRATIGFRGGYYFHIAPKTTAIGGGFYAPNPEDLKRIRKEIEADDTEIRRIINDEKFVKLFGILQGNEVKIAPKGFDKNHPAIDIIKKKQFYAMRYFTDKQVLSANFMKEVVDTYETLRPFFDFMSSVLTTDLNGESTI